jgi:hypothetical protein
VANKATQEAKAICSAMVDDPAYLANLKRRLVRGKLAPAVECMIWHYAKAKPADTLRLEDAIPVLVVDELKPEDVSHLKSERDT